MLFHLYIVYVCFPTTTAELRIVVANDHKP